MSRLRSCWIRLCITKRRFDVFVEKECWEDGFEWDIVYYNLLLCYSDFSLSIPIPVQYSSFNHQHLIFLSITTLLPTNTPKSPPRVTQIRIT